MLNEEMDNASKRVLIVEDFDDIRALLKLALEAEGYTIIEATDGKLAVEVAKEQEPNIILMDISLPLLDGLSAIKTIKSIESLRDIPVIVVSAYENVERRARRAGSRYFISKPIDLDELKRAIRQLLDAG